MTSITITIPLWVFPLIATVIIVAVLMLKISRYSGYDFSILFDLPATVAVVLFFWVVYFVLVR